MREEREPHFLVHWESRRQRWRGTLAVVLTTRVAGGASLVEWLLPDLDRVGAQPDRWAIFSSFLLHFALILFCARVPMGWLFAYASTRQPMHEEDIKLIYPLPRRALTDYLPSLEPPGKGGKPGHGNLPDKPPARGSLEWHPRFTVVSNPPHPDNPTQTIIQPSSPPDLKIQQELKLPNIVLTGLTPPRMPLKAALRAPAEARPVEAQAPISPDLPFIPPDAMPPPLAPATVENPHLPVPVGSAVPQLSAQAKETQTTARGLGGNAPEANQPGLIILSANASSLANLLGLPPGNRYGEFAISPAGGKPGSPGGERGGVVGGGTGGSGTGGDSSAGVGSGNSGGGGSGTGAGGFFSVKGGKLRGNGEGLPALSSTLAVNMVFPVTAPSIHVRENSLVVSAGPIGGGGLDTYGVLRCAGVYTVYLAMPRASWPLEYCREEEQRQPEEARAATGTVRLAGGVVPPQPEKQFDFHRPPIPPLKANKLIILKGKIAKDGSVGHLKLLQGVTKAADEAAMAAFARWTFKPALEGGKPIAVDFLVGIPATLSGR
jgi:Gram-negative bacterial TonB protein C-terminal